MFNARIVGLWWLDGFPNHKIKSVDTGVVGKDCDTELDLYEVHLFQLGVLCHDSPLY